MVKKKKISLEIRMARKARRDLEIEGETLKIHSQTHKTHKKDKFEKESNDFTRKDEDSL